MTNLDVPLDVFQCSSLSYIRARDPSIIFHSTTAIQGNRVKLAQKLSEVSSILDDKSSEWPALQSIQVFLRVKAEKPLEGLYSIQGKQIECFVPNTSNICRNVKDGNAVSKKFTFSHIFKPNSTQEDIFNRTVKTKIFDFINGKNSNIMTYGASGAGKTFTIVGTSSHPGVIPRALDYLFRSLPTLAECPSVKPVYNKVLKLSAEEKLFERGVRKQLLNIVNTTIDPQHTDTFKIMQQRLSILPVADLECDGNVSISIWVSFAEIYNEFVYDLLVPERKTQPRAKLQLGKVGDNIFVKGLTNVNISSSLEAYQILQYGLHNLKYASTAINSHSSRSHCIFTIKMIQAVEDKGYHVSYFNFCDLAGSERSKKTGNAGARLRESNNINTSLLVLGRCISIIRDSQNKPENVVIPFRESKLTMLFQTALLGKEELNLIVNINANEDMFDESHHALNFSAIATQIIVTRRDEITLKRRKPTLDTTSEETARLKEKCKDLEKVIEDLIQRLEEQRLQHREEEQNAIETNSELVKEFIENCNKQWQKRLNALEEQLTEQRNLEIQELREYYEEILRKYNINEDDDKVVLIVLDSDEEENMETNENNNSEVDLQTELIQEETKQRKETMSELYAEINGYELTKEESMETNENNNSEVELQTELIQEKTKQRKETMSELYAEINGHELTKEESMETNENNNSEVELQTKLVQEETKQRKVTMSELYTEINGQELTEEEIKQRKETMSKLHAKLNLSDDELIESSGNWLTFDDKENSLSYQNTQF